MERAEKEQVVADLAAKFAKADSIVVNFKGCTCASLTSLRRKLKQSDAGFEVIKNTLAERASQNTAAAGLSNLFVGETAIVWLRDDVVGPAKLVRDFAKENEHFKVKGGVVEGKVVTTADLQTLANLPSRTELLGKLLGLLNAPAVKLLGTINAPASSLVRLLEAWRAKKEGQGQGS